MKTKEIEVWVFNPAVEKFKDDVADSFISFRHAGADEQNYSRAKLIIELPERKVEITESEYLTLVKEIEDEKLHRRSSHHLPEDIGLKWYKKLFGKE